MASDHSSFGDLLRHHRLEAGLTQEGLAERSGVSVRAISDLERGLKQRPQRETVRLLCEGLQLKESDREAFIAVASHRPERGAPASRNRVSSASALPVPRTSFIGRDTEVAHIVALLEREDVALLTITGPGGVGKTRLALAVAARLVSAFPDGVVFVDLAPIADPEHVMSVIATALNLDAAPGRSALERLIAVLRTSHMLILLDNCEQVLAAAPYIGELLRACADLTILATSREALSLQDERQWPLLPLPLPDLERLPPLAHLRHSPPVALFVARAESSDPQFALTRETVQAVATICHLVDGLPLAIELAAARVRLLSPRELASQLERRLPLLTSGTRDAPARQQTMRDAISWSYDLLAPHEQALFRHLGVFAGGWTVEAAVAVVLLPNDRNVLEVLASLLDKSLVWVVERGDVSRYGMLETVREFALEQLEREGERAATRERHAAYFLRLASLGAVALEGGEQKRWLRILEREHPNLLEVFTTLETRGDDAAYLRLATALAMFWFFHDHADEGLRHLQRALVWEGGQTVARAKALVGAGMVAYAAGDYINAERWLREGEDLARILAEQPVVANAMYWRGAVAEHLGDEIGAEAFLRAALVIAQEIGHAWLLGVILLNLSDAAFRRGDLEAAERYALAAVAPIAESGNAYAESINFVNLAQVALARGDIRCAAEAVSEALDVAEEMGSRWTVANAIAGAAAVAAARGQHEQAARLLGAASRVLDASGRPRFPQFYLVSQTEDMIRRTLGPDRFEVGWNAGQAWSLEDGVDDTRAVLAEAGGSR
jgi:predicted ATPase/transcriptional regulator with XRE-family HTH domain